MVNILGLSFDHDSGATLLQDGDIAAAANEERFNRRKHYGSYPVKSIEYCLDVTDISATDADAIAVPTEGALVNWTRSSTAITLSTHRGGPTSLSTRLQRIPNRPES